jgi:hypothetical protein
MFPIDKKGSGQRAETRSTTIVKILRGCGTPLSPPARRRVAYATSRRSACGTQPRSTGAIDASAGGGVRRVVVDFDREMNARRSRASKAPSAKWFCRRIVADDEPEFDSQLLDESNEEDDTGAEISMTDDGENEDDKKNTAKEEKAAAAEEDG